jgi:NitT/TauT family transport system substrate-binding protein
MRGCALLNILAFLFVAAVGATNGGEARAQEALRIVPTNLGELSYAPVFLAIEAGFFRQEGLDPQIIAAGGGSNAAAILLANEAELGMFTTNQVFRLASRGQSLPILAPNTVSGTVSLIVAQETLSARGVKADERLDAKMQKLKGIRVGISAPGSISDAVARFSFRQAGLNPDQDVQIVPLGSITNAVVAFKQKRVDGVIANYPAITQALAAGGVILIDSSKDVDAFRGIVGTGLVANPRWLDAKPDKVRAAMRAYVKAQHMLATEPKRSFDMIYDKWFAKFVERADYDKSWAATLKTFATVDTDLLTRELIDKTAKAAEIYDNTSYKYDFNMVARPQFIAEAVAAFHASLPRKK